MGSTAPTTVPPSLSSFWLGSGYITALVSGSVLLGVIAVLRLEPQLPRGVNGVG